MKDFNRYEAQYFTCKTSIDPDNDPGFYAFVFAFFALVAFICSLFMQHTFFNAWSISFLIATILLVAAGICWIRFVLKADDFDYTVILKENCFTIEGTPKAPWHAWPLDCTYEFDNRASKVTIYDSVGNHQTYFYDNEFRAFLEGIQRN